MKGNKELEILCKIEESEKEVWEKIKYDFKEPIEDIYFNYPEICLRVREITQKWEELSVKVYKLTFKEDVFRKKKWLYSMEYETGVDGNIVDILKKLGFESTLKIEMMKYYCKNGIEIQKVKGLGLFLEAEGKNRKEIWQRIKKTGIKVSKELGIGKPEMVFMKVGQK